MVKNTGGVASYLTSYRLAHGIPHKVLFSHSQPAIVCCLLNADLSEGNKFSVGEQWAELYNDEELRLALEETMSPK